MSAFAFACFGLLAVLVLVRLAALVLGALELHRYLATFQPLGALGGWLMRLGSFLDHRAYNARNRRTW